MIFVRSHEPAPSALILARADGSAPRILSSSQDEFPFLS
jgi:hypothetical protein